MTLMYTIEFDPTEPSYPSMIRLSLESSFSKKSRVFSLRSGQGFISTPAVPRGRGHARGGARGDAFDGVGNDFVPY